MVPFDIIEDIQKEIVGIVHTSKIILFSHKVNLQHELTSFKLCVVIGTDEKQAAERKLYRALECPIPFDIVLYTAQEWEKSLAQEHSFAQSINKKGTVLYDQTPHQ